MAAIVEASERLLSSLMKHEAEEFTTATLEAASKTLKTAARDVDAELGSLFENKLTFRLSGEGAAEGANRMLINEVRVGVIAEKLAAGDVVEAFRTMHADIGAHVARSQNMQKLFRAEIERWPRYHVQVLRENVKTLEKSLVGVTEHAENAETFGRTLETNKPALHKRLLELLANNKKLAIVGVGSIASFAALEQLRQDLSMCRRYRLVDGKLEVCIVETSTACGGGGSNNPPRKPTHLPICVRTGAEPAGDPCASPSRYNTKEVYYVCAKATVAEALAHAVQSGLDTVTTVTQPLVEHAIGWLTAFCKAVLYVVAAALSFYAIIKVYERYSQDRVVWTVPQPTYARPATAAL